MQNGYQTMKFCRCKTMKNNKIQPKAVQGTDVANDEQKQTVLTILPKQEVSAEELKRENERLKKMLERGPKTLE